MARSRGFTLIELSIVLVIIGLIVGGILVGQNLIQSAAVRAQVSQLEKLHTSVNTFRLKYNAIPGDMGPATASQFGFPPTNRAGTQGRGDGNGALDAYNLGGVVSNPSWSLGGETAMFWGDLTTANLVDGNFTADQSDTVISGTPALSAAVLQGKIAGNSIIAISYNGLNYFNLLNLSSITYSTGQYFTTSTGAGLTAYQAYSIDKKIDDGMPTSGSVQDNLWAYATLNAGVNDTTSTCYNTTSNSYSISSLANYGAGVNCTLSFRFQ